MNMIEEHDLVVLELDIEELGLIRGDIGTVVGIYSDQNGFEVEFQTNGGKTIGVLTLERKDIRPFSGNAILHVRELDAV
jgi:hypothetical protein